MQTFTERNITFQFPASWHVNQYEKSQLHISAMMKLQNTGAVDFVCCNENAIMLLEVKRFTEKPFANNADETTHFINNLCSQFKDTICGLAVSNICKDEELKPFHEALFIQKRPTTPKIVLFIELENLQENHKKSDIIVDIFQTLKGKFSKLGFAVRVVDSSKLAKSSWKAEVLPC